MNRKVKQGNKYGDNDKHFGDQRNSAKFFSGS